MSDETYYTVLNVPETASLTEVKAAYRNLIKEVHPDTLSTLSPYLRRLAEDKAKEIIEAYSVLSNSAKRREYDRQLGEYRRQSTPPTPPPSTAPPPRRTQQPRATAAPPRPSVVRWLGHNWGPLMRRSRRDLIFVLSMSAFVVWLIATFVVGLIATSSNETSPQIDASCPPSHRVEVNGKFVCPVPSSNSPAFAKAPNPGSNSQVLEKAPSTLTLFSSPNPSTFGQSVTFTASVGAQSGGTPTGEVTFMKGGSDPLGTVSLNGGLARYTTAGLAVGAAHVNAVYRGSSSFYTSASSTLSQVVTQASTTTTPRGSSPAAGEYAMGKQTRRRRQ
jgi:hypothetical protein